MSTQKSPIWLAVDQLKEQISALTLKVDERAKPASVITPAVPDAVHVQAKAEPTNNPMYFPTPPDFVETVDLVLNKSFGVRCEPMRDAPAFIFTIIVPDKYSSLSATHKQMNLEDARTKVITFSDGVNGVRLWCEKVFNNFDKDTQFRITEDRPFAQRTL